MSRYVDTTRAIRRARTPGPRSSSPRHRSRTRSSLARFSDLRIPARAARTGRIARSSLPGRGRPETMRGLRIPPVLARSRRDFGRERSRVDEERPLSPLASSEGLLGWRHVLHGPFVPGGEVRRRAGPPPRPQPRLLPARGRACTTPRPAPHRPRGGGRQRVGNGGVGSGQETKPGPRIRRSRHRGPTARALRVGESTVSAPLRSRAETTRGAYAGSPGPSFRGDPETPYRPGRPVRASIEHRAKPVGVDPGSPWRIRSRGKGPSPRPRGERPPSSRRLPALAGATRHRRAGGAQRPVRRSRRTTRFFACPPDARHTDAAPDSGTGRGAEHRCPPGRGPRQAGYRGGRPLAALVPAFLPRAADRRVWARLRPRRTLPRSASRATGWAGSRIPGRSPFGIGGSPSRAAEIGRRRSVSPSRDRVRRPSREPFGDGRKGYAPRPAALRRRDGSRRSRVEALRRPPARASGTACRPRATERPASPRVRPAPSRQFGSARSGQGASTARRPRDPAGRLDARGQGRLVSPGQSSMNRRLHARGAWCRRLRDIHEQDR